MLEEKGVVVEIVNSVTAKINVKRSGACGQCASKSICHSMGPSGEMIVEVNNPLGAKVGQEVILSLPSKTFLKASVIVYLIPVLALFAGAIIVQYFSENWAPAGALLGLGLSFLWLWFYNKSLKPNDYAPTITSLLNK